MVSRLVVPVALVVAVVLGAPHGFVLAQIAIDIDAAENGGAESWYLPVGGTSIAPAGLILTEAIATDPVQSTGAPEQPGAEEEPQEPSQEPAAQGRYEATPSPEVCAGIDAYLDAVRAAQVEYHVAVEEDGLSDAIAYPLNSEAQTTLTSLDWIALAVHDEALMSTFKVIDPPPGAVNWHAFQLELIAFQSAFDRSAAAVGFETTARHMHKVSAELVKRQERERIAAVKACPGFTVLYPDLARRTLPAPTGKPEPPVDQATPNTEAAEDGSLATPSGILESISAEAEASCATGPVYPPGTDLVVVRDTLLQTATGDAEQEVPAGTLVRTTGPFVENGLCDLWPVSAIPPSPSMAGLIDERFLALAEAPAS